MPAGRIECETCQITGSPSHVDWYSYGNCMATLLRAVKNLQGLSNGSLPALCCLAFFIYSFKDFKLIRLNQ